MTKARQIISLNCAAWGWKLTDEPYADRLKRICRFLKSNTSQVLAIGLQEVIVGERYLALLQAEFPNFEVILPVGYNLKNNKRSAICILLINKNYATDISLRALDSLYTDKLDYRYNYVSITTHDGYYRLLNVHIPQTVYNENQAPWYTESRIKLKAALEKSIIDLAVQYRNEPDMAFILLGNLNAAPTSQFYEKLAATCIDRPMMDCILPRDSHIATWINPLTLESACLDYIFYSMGMISERSSYTCRPGKIIQNTISDKISDHAMVVASIEGHLKL